GGQATYTTSGLSAGTHTITARYSGDANFNVNASATPLSENITSANTAFVQQAYVDLLHRSADPGGLIAWVNALDSGSLTRTQVSMGIEGSQEFRGVEVQGLYERFLHRSADPAGLGGGVSFLMNGGSIEQLEAILIGSTEYFQTRAGGTNDGFLNALYEDVLHRPIDQQSHDRLIQFL